MTREDAVAAAEGYGIDKTGISMDNITAEHPPGYWQQYADARVRMLMEETGFTRERALEEIKRKTGGDGAVL